MVKTELQKKDVLNEKEIRSKIYNIRSLQVMIDYDLADLYAVKTKRLNEQVKRNRERFPESFMFQLTKLEKDKLVAKCDHLKTLKFSPTIPYAFTEQGVAMLSAVLKSEIAVKVSIKIIEAFVAMRKFLLKNAEIFQRLDKTEQKLLDHDNKFEKVFNLIQSKDIKPSKGIFFNGQIFDAHNFFSDIIRTANSSIILIDNYIDDSVLTLFTKTKENVKITIFTKEISEQLQLDLKKYNSQYPSIEIKEFKKCHDRFIILDNKKVYHFGASLKDLGKKWFAFSKFDKEAFVILNKLELK
ncbi:MAG: ORF6N domain-containing protein [Nanoarchaeota archaeon]|nr:ORF6N domain-containing protein [Nanoarchaeota archaeon]